MQITEGGLCTGDADVTGFQVGHDLLGTAVHRVQHSVRNRKLITWNRKSTTRNRKLTLTTTGTLAVEVGEDVGRAADAAVVFTHTSAEPHTTIATTQHQNHVVSSGTRRVKVLPLTVLDHRSGRHIFNRAQCTILNTSFWHHDHTCLASSITNIVLYSSSSRGKETGLCFSG